MYEWKQGQTDIKSEICSCLDLVGTSHLFFSLEKLPLKTLPMEKWLEEQGLAQDHPDAKVFIIEMKKRINDVIIGTIFLKENIVMTIEDPKVKFETFINGTFKNIIVARVDEELFKNIVKAKENTEMVSNFHPPSKVSFLNFRGKYFPPVFQ